MKQIKPASFILIALSIISLFGYYAFSGRIAGNLEPQRALSKILVRPLAMTGSAGNFRDLTLKTVIPNKPEKLMVYKVQKPSVNRDKIVSQAKKLGIEGNVKETDIDISIRSDEGEFIIDKDTGSFNYMTKEFELQAEPLITVLSDEEYQKRAEAFLRENGLMKNHAEFRVVNKGNVTLDGGGTERPYIIEVGFGKDLNGQEWNGVGPKISVYFGEEGRIIGAASVWREVEPYKEYPIISLSDAVSKAREGKAMVYNANRNDRGVIKRADILYMNDPIGYYQEFVIPFYRMHGKTEAGQEFSLFVRAVPEELMEEKPVPNNANVPQNHKNR